jgi:hypothetical protein
MSNVRNAGKRESDSRTNVVCFGGKKEKNSIKKSSPNIDCLTHKILNFISSFFLSRNFLRDTEITLPILGI